MSAIFNTAEEARKYIENFRHNNINFIYRQDTNRMLANVTKLVTELSQLEVEARQSRKQHKVIECKARLETAISHLKTMFVWAKLMS
jgi:hypothetical protein